MIDDNTDKAAKFKSEYLAYASHDLRAYISSIMGITSLMQDGHLSREQMDYLGMIRSNADSLLSIVNDILDLSKADFGALEMDLLPFDLISCVEDALDVAAPKAAAKNLNLAYMTQGGVPRRICGDSLKLRQVLVNLIDNAIKFTDKGEVLVSIAGCRGAGNAWSIHFAVRDTGIGISEDSMDKLFKPFSQADPSIARMFGGTGLGLAISKRLVELMGGRIWIKSILGKGSTFHFTINASEDLDPLPPEREAADLPKKSLLVLEGNNTNRMILRSYLLSWGMRIKVASTLEAALNLIRICGPFDAAVLDALRPEDLGPLREILSRTSTPIIALTPMGITLPRDAFSAHLTLPIKPSKLRQALAGIFAPAPLQEEPLPQGGADREGPIRILLADDDPVNRIVVARMLKSLGYSADMASDGLSALQSIESKPYDLVLMDLQMPEMDGLDAARAIRKGIPAAKQPYIVAMTASILEEDMDMCLVAGMDGYLSKPVSREDLSRVLENVLGRTK